GLSCYRSCAPRALDSFPTRRSSDLAPRSQGNGLGARGGPLFGDHCSINGPVKAGTKCPKTVGAKFPKNAGLKNPQPQLSSCIGRSEEHTSELQSRENLVCRLLLDK